MESPRSSEQAFTRAADRNAHEDAHMARQLSEQGQRAVEGIDRETKQEIRQTRIQQAVSYPHDLAVAVEAIRQDTLRPDLRPPGFQKLRPSIAKAERTAQRHVDTKNREALVRVFEKGEQRVAEVYRHEGLDRAQFSKDRARVNQMRADRKQQNEITREER
jgi:hypothetical protein